ncbi:D-tyrosyl-tRNA deacylase [Neolentinus lepideus HHB14362 ss-1]|uniref:D-aminoacyl-tRNA deacylase n=1 Tax=Neolentinus lepideus HHB14362 ss-1 TaxID=1314782 RepID=A0A165RKW6_9AGAM|nr:D-tyrosyl-tRNA deacylase [Neolentinus lepideus HHB14362 ss-1]
MRAIVQRVASASVTVDNVVVSQISKGLMVLVGVGTDDNVSDIETLTKKIVSLRVFNDDSSGAMWKKSVKDIDGEILCVSQFTLLANTTKGNKPDFHRAMSTEPSRQMYATFLERISQIYKPEKIKDGKFGAMMNVSLTNEGPVTFTLDSRKFEYVDQPATGGGGATSSKNRTSTETAQNGPPHPLMSGAPPQSK